MSKQDIAEKVEDYLFGVADAFDNIKRIGSDTDDPEGSRYIIVSDSMANKLSHDLRNCAHKVNEAAEEKSPWIPVPERLPEPYKKVLIWSTISIEPDYGCLMGDEWATFETHGMLFGKDRKGKITHWMPLPQPPE